MSTNSGVIDTTQSMIIIKPDDYPQNFGHTTREDYPVTVYPIQAFDASNVLPTAMGYKSYFDESTSYLLSALPAETQKVLVYQSSNLDNLMLAFGEYGIKVGRPTTPTADNWETLVDTSASAVPNVRRLWTYCVIANRLYMYQQGHSKFYALVDQATYDAASGASLIAGATRTRLWNKWGTGLISYIPSFINMAGQIGLFRADNRLGFWDSYNAVAWSSAVAIEDFKPDVKTFAGVTTFADVQGRIVMVLGSGDEFIIYATKSIVMARGLANSPEKWSGTAIMSEVGVAFDSQVCAGQPDQLQFCITQAGLLQLNQGAPEYIASEVMDYLSKESPSLALSMIDGRYLFISTLNEFKASSYQVTGVVLTDINGGAFLFPKPTYPTTWIEAIELTGRGDNGDNYFSFGDFEPVVDYNTIPTDVQLIPCYTLKGFDSTWANTSYSENNYGSVNIPSKLDGSSWNVTGFKVAPVVTANSYYTDTVYDKAGEEFINEVKIAHDRYLAHKAYQDAFATSALTLSYPVNLSKVAAAGLTSGMVATYDNEPIDEELFFDLLSGNLKVESNKCRFKAYWDQYSNVRIKYKFTGIEQVTGGSRQYLFWDGGHYIDTYVATYTYGPEPQTTISRTWTQETNYGPFYCTWLMTEELATEFMAFLAARADLIPFYGTITNPYAQNGSTLETVGKWMLRYHSDKIDYCSCSIQQAINYIWHWITSEALVSQGPGAFPLELGVDTQLRALKVGCAKDLYDPDTYQYDWGSVWAGVPGVHNSSGEWDCSELDAERKHPLYAQVNNTATTWIVEEFYYNYPTDLRPAIYEEHGYPGDGYPAGDPEHTLVGTITADVVVEPGTATDVTLYDAELSGWGYIPSGGFSFRKTHSRHFSTSCPMPINPKIITHTEARPNTWGSVPDWGITVPPYTPNPPYNWQYPDAIPLPPTTALFQKGSLSPYYQTYKGAAVYDMLLTKFGIYNNDHKALVNLMPVNRVDSTIMPVIDAGMFGGALRPDGKVSLFKEGNPASYIVYGKIGYYRRGISLATEAVAHFSVPATGQLIVECSMDGRTINKDLSYAVPLNGDRLAILPFTLRAKWFTIRVEGNFELTYLELRAERKGRR